MAEFVHQLLIAPTADIVEALPVVGAIAAVLIGCGLAFRFTLRMVFGSV